MSVIIRSGGRDRGAIPDRHTHGECELGHIGPGPPAGEEMDELEHFVAIDEEAAPFLEKPVAFQRCQGARSMM